MYVCGCFFLFWCINSKACCIESQQKIVPSSRLSKHRWGRDGTGLARRDCRISKNFVRCNSRSISYTCTQDKIEAHFSTYTWVSPGITIQLRFSLKLVLCFHVSWMAGFLWIFIQYPATSLVTCYRILPTVSISLNWHAVREIWVISRFRVKYDISGRDAGGSIYFCQSREYRQFGFGPHNSTKIVFAQWDLI